MVRKKNARDKFKRIVIAFLAIILLSGIFLAYDFYHRFTDSNIDLPNDQHEGYLYILPVQIMINYSSLLKRAIR
jgi:hypothetical protein